MSKPNASDLPNGWAWATLDELAAAEPRAITDGPFGSNLASRHYTSTGARVIRLQNIGDGRFVDGKAYISLDHFNTLRAHEVREGDVLVASLGEALPRACLTPAGIEPAIVKADCIRVRPHPAINPKWLVYTLNAPETRAYAGARIRGVGRPRLGLGELRKVPLPVPPLAEQHRIVDALEDHLSRLDAAQRAAEQALARTAALRERITSITFGIDVPDDRPRARILEPAGTDDGLLARIPATWRWRRLDEIADVVGGITKDAKKQADPLIPEVPYLRVANVQRGRLDLSHVALVRVPAKKADQLALQPGDVLLNEGGDRNKLGRGWIWEGQIPGAIHQNHVFRARPRPDSMHPKLLSWYANSMAHWFEVNGKQSVNLASISLSKIKKLPVPVPPPDEQQAIVDRIETQLSALDAAAQTAQAALLKATALRRSLLAAAFSGRLVSQDPADEPAAALLDRLASPTPTPRPSRRLKSATVGRRATSIPVPQELPL